MTVDLPAELAAGIAALAAAEGRSPEEYLRELVEREVRTKRRPETRAERYARLKADIVASGLPLLSDEEVLAEIRERRGSRTEQDD